jgi:hypothetical protein
MQKASSLIGIMYQQLPIQYLATQTHRWQCTSQASAVLKFLEDRLPVLETWGKLVTIGGKISRQSEILNRVLNYTYQSVATLDGTAYCRRNIPTECKLNDGIYYKKHYLYAYNSMTHISCESLQRASEDRNFIRTELTLRLGHEVSGFILTVVKTAG